MNRRFVLLKTATSIQGIAPALGYTPRGLSYVLYKIPDEVKYLEFQIPKRSGGMRTISAPHQELRRLQKNLASLLESCNDDLDALAGVVNTLSHGFRKKHSILTNAARHRRSRYVFNIDLKDFFGTINFGRVSGFFQKNRGFALDPTAARIIAQIACQRQKLPDGTTRTVLPQGSPCSPIISNLIAHILDVRMVKLAARFGCHYSRYADDLTFSSNHKIFPSEIAQRIGETTQWVASKALIKEIRRCGFELNEQKTRMQYREFRQDVTGIIVNSKLNVRTEYAKEARAMVHSLVTKGMFHVTKKTRDDKGQWVARVEPGNVSKLRGMLSFIDTVRYFEKVRVEQLEDLDAKTRLARHEAPSMDSHLRTYRKFLNFTLFYRPVRPLIICEGKTDNVYLLCALQALAATFPKLVTVNEKGIIKPRIGFFNYSKTTHRVLALNGGADDLRPFVTDYGKEFSSFRHAGTRHPVIVLVDNDGASKKIFSAIKTITGSKTDIDGKEPFYYLRDNLYVVALPEVKAGNTEIEDFFETTVLETKLGKKVFSRKDTFEENQYGKHVFAERVVKKNRQTINFSAFGRILERITAALDHYDGLVAAASKKAPGSTAVSAVATTASGKKAPPPAPPPIAKEVTTLL